MERISVHEWKGAVPCSETGNRVVELRAQQMQTDISEFSSSRIWFVEVCCQRAKFMPD